MVVKAKITTFELDAEFGLLPDKAEPGLIELRLEENMIILACPGCGHVSGMRASDPKPKTSPSWLIRGVPESITLTPSINCIGCCKWHGWLTNGVFHL